MCAYLTMEAARDTKQNAIGSSRAVDQVWMH